MFPLAQMNPAHISPLTANEFVRLILVPEVALRLIMEDKGLEGNEGMQQGLAILRESSAYGVAMFPDDGESVTCWRRREEERIGVGDMIVMERARKRRKELEEMDKREEEEIEAKKVKTCLDAHRHGMQKVYEEVRRPRPRPVMKSSRSRSIIEATSHQKVSPSTYCEPHTLPPTLPMVTTRTDMGIAPISRIPKPEGEVGRPRRGGYNLEATLGWHSKEYRHVKVLIYFGGVVVFFQLMFNVETHEETCRRSSRFIQEYIGTRSKFSSMGCK